MIGNGTTARLRRPLPRRRDVRLVDTLGRRGHGDAALARRLYAEERCSVDEIALWLKRPAYEVAAMLRPRRDEARATRAFNAWLRTG